MAGPRTPLARHARTAALFLLLGAITTILVSWMFALLGSAEKAQFHYGTGEGGPKRFPWPVHVPTDWPPQADAVQLRTGRGVHFDDAIAVDEFGRDYRILSTRFGWPLAAMHYRWESVGQRGHQVVRTLPSIAVPNWLDDLIAGFATTFPAKRRLPLVPLWPGFLFNSLLFAILFWLVLRLRKTWRVAIRRRRDQCIACGYPIGESAVCTECGAEVRSTQAAT